MGVMGTPWLGGADMKPSQPAPMLSSDVLMQVVVDDDNRVSMPATLGYSATDPYAISVTFRTAEGDITWTFARDLLQTGMTESVGEGDIRIRPAHPSRGPVMNLSLSSPSGSADIEAARQDVAAFLGETFEMVPGGSEWMYLDLDRTIDDLLADPLI